MRWDAARSTAAELGRTAPAPSRTVPVTAALGSVLARPLVAATDLPPSALSAMDGWAVSGPGPWTVRGTVLAGDLTAGLGAGEAVGIATGAWVPAGTSAVVRSEHGRLEAGRLVADAPQPGTDVRPHGREARAGSVLVPAGRLVTPAVVGLACAAGLDTLDIRTPAQVTVLVVGDELLSSGPPTAGRVRDVLGPLLPGWLGLLGADVAAPVRLPDDLAALTAALREADGDLVVTTGATAHGPVDHLRRALTSVGAVLAVDTVDVRPGHPMLLARLPDGRAHAGLPGNPLAAVAALLTLVDPWLRARAGQDAGRRTLALARDVAGHPHDTRLVPVRDGIPTDHAGPAMLRGLVEADAVAVIGPGGARAGDVVQALGLPWAARDLLPPGR